MEERIVVKPNTYHDSVTLMSVTQRVLRLDGVSGAMIGMGTALNMEVLSNLGFKSAVKAGPNDLILALRAEKSKIEEVFEQVEEMLSKGSQRGEAKEEPARNLAQALERQPSNMALISVPGAFAAYEARKALEQGLHVMLFSDNVSIEQEISLKRFAHKKGLLVMGPDCGTAIINGVPLAFANKVRRGGIGIVGASGTGIQEVCVQIDRRGQGISQVIGTGGRDLSQAVGGLMMLDGIAALKEDPETKVIVVVSKPAAPEVADKVFEALNECGKPAVYYVIGDKGNHGAGSKVKRAGNLLETAVLAVEVAERVFFEEEIAVETLVGELSTRDTGVRGEGVLPLLARKLQGKLRPTQKYVRGLFSGGTLCDEAMVELSEKLGLIYSNGPLVSEGKLRDANKSFQHTVLDLGDDQFTVGRPHPMIDFTLRAARIVQEADDPETAVILLDVVLGYGSNPDPAKELVPAISKAREVAWEREVLFVAYVCGTELDPQGYKQQVEALKQAGVYVCTSNLEAARLAGEIALLRQAKGGEKLGGR